MRNSTVEVRNEKGEFICQIPSNIIRAFKNLIEERKAKEIWGNIIYLKRDNEYVNLIYTDSFILIISRFPHYLKNPLLEEGVIRNFDGKVIRLNRERDYVELKKIVSLFPSNPDITFKDNRNYYFLNLKDAADAYKFISNLQLEGEFHYFIPLKDLSFYYFKDHSRGIKVFIFVSNVEVKRNEILGGYNKEVRKLKRGLIKGA